MYLKKHYLSIFIVFIVLFFSCSKKISSNTPPAPVVKTDSFLHRAGKIIVDGGNKPIQLQGIAFGNEVFTDKEIPTTHHTEEDFKRVKDMHMNVIRFYMNYKTFENDNTPYQYKQTGWDWINTNIAWAKKHGIYLILNMHVPQGGYQSQGTGDALWNSNEYQNRLTALWKAIANKYKKETQIAGFGLLNEPVPNQSMQQWKTLAQKMADGIRTEDTNHILFVEKAIYVKNNVPEDADLNFPFITDKNTAYEFHIYDPIQYTHQLFDWAKQGEGGKYPDENVISYTSGTWYTGTFNNPAIKPGNTDWVYIEGLKYKITDPKIKIGLPALSGSKVSGKVYFDDIVIKEYDANGAFVQDVLTMSLDEIGNWSYWSVNNTGNNGLATIGHSNGKSLYIENSKADCNISNYLKLFIPKQNYSYQINGWMKGENVADTAECKFRIDFLTTNDPILKRNKQLLEANIKKLIDWSTAKNVPLYMGEFGAGSHCFVNNKGGLQWVTDMVDIAKLNAIPFTYHSYHEDSFGLYLGYGTLPDPSKTNQPLIDLFKTKLK